MCTINSQENWYSLYVYSKTKKLYGKSLVFHGTKLLSP